MHNLFQRKMLFLHVFFNVMERKCSFIIVIFLVGILSMPAGAQFYNGLQMTFGKNRVQYSTEKIWSHFRFENFDTYFYQGGKELAIQAAKYAEFILPDIQKKIEYYLDVKLQFVIFNSMSDMKESNIGLADEDQYNIGGITQVIGRTVILYFDGNSRNFEQQIRKGIASVLVNQMLYGQEIGANIKNSALLFLPPWFTEGLVSYIADDWTTSLDNTARDGFLSGRYRKFNNLTGYDVVVAGHSLWKYISDKYGEHAIPNIVYMTKISRSVENGFLYFLGTSFKNLSAEWFLYYSEKYKADSDIRSMPPEASEIPLKLKQEEIVLHFKASPDGKYFAYTTDNLNKKCIWIVDAQTGKRKRIFKTGYRIDEERDMSYPLLAWHPRGELLAFLIEKKGIIHLYYYLPETNKIERQSIFGVHKIHAMSYSPNGLSLLVSATVNGQSDIFLYHLASKTFEQITKDIYDDIDPRFVQNGRYIAFSSNRASDTLVFDVETNMKDYSVTPRKSDHFNIYLYNYGTRSPILWKVTDLKTGDATQPLPVSKNTIQFLSDQNGISNLYFAQTDSAISYVDTIIHYRYFSTISPASDFSRGIIQHDVDDRGEALTQIFYADQTYSVYLNKESPNQMILPVNPKNTFYMDEIISDLELKKNAVIPNTAGSKQSYPITPKDTSKVNINNYIFRGYRTGGTDTTKTKDTSVVKKPDVKKDTTQTPSFVLPYQRNYDVEFSINQLVSQLDYSFLNYSYQLFSGPGPVFLSPGINAFFKIGINDLLEDYRIIGGLRLSFNFRNNEYFLGFENYKGRLDKKIIFHRQGYEQFTETNYIQHKQNSIHYIIQHPFNNVLALRTSFLLRQNKAHYMSIDYQNLLKPSIGDYWGGAKAELVFDNTRNPQLNIYYGQRWKMWVEYLQYLSKEPTNLGVVGFDYRHYAKIHRNFIWANRIAASSSMGNSKLIYFLGGVDNWLFPRFNYNINISHDKNYVFQTLATNMRGFDQNIRNGNSFTVINSELRMPIFSYLMNRPLRSEFFNNFQIVGFGDIGTAWEGVNPFSEDNSLFTHIVYSNPVTVVVRRQKNPIVGGFGAGIRSKILGYFLKTDLAWGLEDGKISKPIFYLSLSLDF